MSDITLIEWLVTWDYEGYTYDVVVPYYELRQKIDDLIEFGSVRSFRAEEM